MPTPAQTQAQQKRTQLLHDDTRMVKVIMKGGVEHSMVKGTAQQHPNWEALSWVQPDNGRVLVVFRTEITGIEYE